MYLALATGEVIQGLPRPSNRPARSRKRPGLPRRPRPHPDGAIAVGPDSVERGVCLCGGRTHVVVDTASPEQSEITSIKERLPPYPQGSAGPDSDAMGQLAGSVDGQPAADDQPAVAAPTPLTGFAPKVSMLGTDLRVPAAMPAAIAVPVIPLTFEGYAEPVDWTGRAVRDGKEIPSPPACRRCSAALGSRSRTGWGRLGPAVPPHCRLVGAPQAEPSGCPALAARHRDGTGDVRSSRHLLTIFAGKTRLATSPELPDRPIPDRFRGQAWTQLANRCPQASEFLEPRPRRP